jgi:hypothetical protein
MTIEIDYYYIMFYFFFKIFIHFYLKSLRVRFYIMRENSGLEIIK